MQNKNEIQEVSKKTGISVKELNRLNQDFWYHGTTIEDAENIRENGVIANYNLGLELDFGPGFYLTDTYQRAINYISRVPSTMYSGGIQEREDWAIIEFAFNPYELLFSKENIYSYRNFPKHNKAFAEFVFRNRMNNREKENPHKFDLIWGVMSDSNPEQVVWDYKNQKISYEKVIQLLQKSNSMKQLFISNQEICDMLVINNIFMKEDNGYARKINN